MAQISIFVTKKDENVRENCKHFYQHYVKTGPFQYHKVFAGHCCFPRMKNKEATDTCRYFERRDKND